MVFREWPAIGKRGSHQINAPNLTEHEQNDTSTVLVTTPNSINWIDGILIFSDS